MTREEAITWLIQPTVTSTKVSASKAKEQEAYDMAIEALQVEPTKAVCDDCIWHVCNYNKVDWDTPSAEVVHKPDYSYEADMVRRMKEALSAEAEWIPCSERLPKDLEVVNITWINHRPMTYYADIKDKPFTSTAIHYKDKWWWYSPICEDMLAEYGKSECDKMDADIEVTAWMPLPKPWKGADDE